MSAKSLTCYTVICDGCGEDIDVDNDGTILHFSSADEARDRINSEDAGACVQGGDWCRRCQYKPHAFVADEDWSEMCGRCNLDQDDHETPAGPDASIDLASGPATASTEPVPPVDSRCQCRAFPMERGADDCPNHVPDGA